MLELIQENIYKKAKDFRTDNTFQVDTYAEFKSQLEKNWWIY